MSKTHDFVSNRNAQECLEDDCGLDPAHPVHNKRMPPGPGYEFAGDAPFFLVFEPPDGQNVGIDLDVTGWIDANKELFRAPGTWFLMEKKQQRPVFAVPIAKGDQFYYTKHHVGNLMAGTKVMAWGLGKKEAGGRTVNLWLMPNGLICGGDDVDLIASRMLGG